MTARALTPAAWAVAAPGFGALHGFTTRAGGLSGGPYASLNLGLSSGDERAAVEANRDALLAALGFARQDVCAFHQVHGDRVLDGAPAWFSAEADAAVTQRDDVLLVVSSADCVPLLFHDPAKGVVGAAHCGWKGTSARLAGKVVAAMAERYGSDPADVRAVIGPSIRGGCYQVGSEVVERFVDAGFPDDCWRPDPEVGERYLLDLPAANSWALAQAGVAAAHVTDLGLCTHCDAQRFYSHRRDRGVTGRHWAYVSLRGAPAPRRRVPASASELAAPVPERPASASNRRLAAE